jgi:D-mannonate dehydratase
MGELGIGTLCYNWHAVSTGQLWAAHEYFLRAVVPVAEEAGMRICLRPDDPPHARGLRPGAGHLPSAYSGITVCQGNFTMMTDDLPALIRRWGAQGKIFFVHFRDVAGDASRFIEVFHDEGPTNMLECMRAYHETGFDARCARTTSRPGRGEQRELRVRHPRPATSPDFATPPTDGLRPGKAVRSARKRCASD